MTDDDLQEGQDDVLEPQAAEEPQTQDPEPKSTVDENDTPEGDTMQDRLRQRFSSTTAIGISIVLILVVSLVIALLNQEAGPTEVDNDWNELNRQILRLRDDVNQNAFEVALYSTAADSMSDDNARAWMNVEIASALIATALRPEDNSQIPPQFRQQQPPSNILAGDSNTIQNRVTSLQTAATHLENAIIIFATAKAKEHPLGTLGHYRAEYSAAYVAEALLLLQGSEAFETNRENVITHLNAATAALPAIQDVMTNRTDNAIHRLRTQIEKRLQIFETMSAEQVTELPANGTVVTDAVMYSWINQYITAKNIVAPSSDALPTSETDVESDEGTNASDDGAFPVNDDDGNSDQTDSDNTQDDSGDSPEQNDTNDD